MSKREFKVGDEVFIKGKLRFIDKEDVQIDIGMFRDFATVLSKVIHAPVKDDTVYEYKYLYKTLDGSWGETLGYYTSKKDALGLDQTLKDVQRLTHTKRVRK